MLLLFPPKSGDKTGRGGGGAAEGPLQTLQPAERRALTSTLQPWRPRRLFQRVQVGANVKVSGREVRSLFPHGIKKKSFSQLSCEHGDASRKECVYSFGNTSGNELFTQFQTGRSRDLYLLFLLLHRSFVGVILYLPPLADTNMTFPCCWLPAKPFLWLPVAGSDITAPSPPPSR